jgi:hypothetical protein
MEERREQETKKRVVVTPGAETCNPPAADKQRADHGSLGPA